MGRLARAGTLARYDARLIGRDSFLSGMIVYMLGSAVLLRFGIPWLADAIAQNPALEIDITGLYPVLIGYIAIYQGAMIGGMMIGFILLDERDDSTLKALLVTPLPISHYMAYRVLGFAMIMLDMLIINVALVPLGQLVLIAAVGALFGPVAMLILATFAENKVQGFAQVRIISTSGLLLFAAWFLQPPLEYIVGLFPPYWAVKAYWLALDGQAGWWIALLVGVVYSGIVIAALVRRFRRVAYS